MELSDLEKYGPITIVAFGDSITHGAVGPGEKDYESVYWNRLKRKIYQVRDLVPVNVINAGIGGYTASRSLARMEKQVFAHMPDLVIVCFGLNDVNEPLETYVNALKTIFLRCREENVETIFMTPNMLNTYVAEGTQDCFLDYARKTAELQNSGIMDTYMKAASETALSMGVKVCDCYSEWKKLSQTQDTTMLLANYINHPKREMHELFADMLFQTLFDGDYQVRPIMDDDLMYVSADRP